MFFIRWLGREMLLELQSHKIIVGTSPSQPQHTNHVFVTHNTTPLLRKHTIVLSKSRVKQRTYVTSRCSQCKAVLLLKLKSAHMILTVGMPFNGTRTWSMPSSITSLGCCGPTSSLLALGRSHLSLFLLHCLPYAVMSISDTVLIFLFQHGTLHFLT